MRALGLLALWPALAAADPRADVAARYARDASARKLALALYDEIGDVADVEVEHDMDGGYRGVIHIVPEVAGAQHLRWVLGAQRELEAVLAGLAKRAAAPLSYRHRGLTWRFFRSVRKHTPSAYASAWSVAYNVSGSLNISATRVRDTMFHEIFHLNDQAHDGWSRRALGGLVDGIIARCRTDVACLTPFAPMPMKVRGGTYYSFQPDNGDNANEYAAELATRYLLEQRAALRGERYAGGRFKCGRAENARAWELLREEFFAGVDLVPDCP
jgi:hypothetical protein